MIKKIGIILFCLSLLPLTSIGCSPRENDASDPTGEQKLEAPPYTVAQSRQTKAVEAPKALQDKGSVHIDQGKRQGATASTAVLPRNKPKVKGIYVTGYVAGGKRMSQIIRTLEQTELNAVVIDIKSDSGYLTYRSKLAPVKQIGADRRPSVGNMSALVQKLKSKNIYTIARLVTFKDPYLAGKRPDFAIHRKSGNVWHDRKGVSWVDPFNKKVWDYNLAIAKEAVSLGFDEIQFDYVRFPDNGAKMDRVVAYRNPNGWTKAEAIHQFLRQAKTELHGKGAYLSADVFGLTTSSRDDMGIGQRWNAISKEVDFICPMIYPSHYSRGNYGVMHPDMQPYAIVRHAIIDAKVKNKQIASYGAKPAAIRPWLQDFTATWVHPHRRYDLEEIRLQVKAAREQGIEEYLLWNPDCRYSVR